MFGTREDSLRLRILVLWTCLFALLWMPGLVVGEEPDIDPAAEEEAVEADGESLDEALADEDGDEAAYDQIEMLTEAILHIRKHYVHPKTYQDIAYGALHGMLGRLDQHSAFLEPEAYSDMQNETSGRFSGIGIHIGMRDGVLTVIAPIEDTPAFRAGLQSGDRIVGIDGQKTMGMSLRDAVKLLRGDKGDAVTVTIARSGEEAPRDVAIVRDDITVPSVKGTRILRDNVGYVRITTFAAPTAAAFQTAVETLLAEGMEALVLDLRSNPGGLLRSAVDVSDLLLRKGDLIVTTRGRGGPEAEVRRKVDGSVHYVDFPIVILVDEGSASASEIVAGALQDHRRAVLVGETTFGKGSVQSVIPLKADGRAAIRLTAAYYYTPSNRLIHEKGIEPDIPVYVSGEEWQKVQMRRAHIENPEFYSDEEIEKYADVVDRALERAVDLLRAFEVFAGAEK